MTLDTKGQMHLDEFVGKAIKVAHLVDLHIEIDPDEREGRDKRVTASAEFHFTHPVRMRRCFKGKGATMGFALTECWEEIERALA